MNEGLNTNREEIKMTPQKMLEEIKKKYPSSHAFVEEIVQAGKDNWGIKTDDYGAQDIAVKLAQLHRSVVVHKEYTRGIKDEEEREKKMYERGLWLGSMAAAIYHGELTMIGDDGKILSNPVPFKKG